MVLLKLEEPLNLWRSNKYGVAETETKNNISLTYSEVSAVSETEKPMKQKGESEKKVAEIETKLKETSKDIEQLLNLIKKIDKEGEWWKSIPKNLKNNSTFKSVYRVLEQYRNLELKIQALESSSTLRKEEDKSIENALNLITKSVAKDNNIFAQDYWTTKLSACQGKSSSDKLIGCLTDLNLKFNKKLAE